MGQFDWFGSIGATPEAVAVLNDQPILFTILLIVLPEQKKKKEKKKPAPKK
ncbi:uncharacterized protein B0H64DRAFT_441089 [Chaetomium fimeti]|uniref:Uncharacterized protein n=1 Tax=Chaetomium fimeti TaxID=1854472 RepID=A0AAE0HK17_9PEZI|nr:hypothetical protein B0H64DRAFT_441089 [Chaetomium fimeti]